jgi:hypothetical protein
MQDWAMVLKSDESQKTKRKEMIESKKDMKIIETAHFAEFDLGLYVYQ